MSDLDGNLESLVEKSRRLLLQDKDSIIFSQINKGFLLKNSCNNITDEHKKVLKIFNGGRFGVVDIWDIDFLQETQYRIPAGTKNLYEVGQILYEPIFINNLDDKVSFIENDIMVNTDLNFYDFIIYYVFGDGYSVIVQNDSSDLWLEFINKKLIYKNV